jgi:acetolactate decarboxylase
MGKLHSTYHGIRFIRTVFLTISCIFFLFSFGCSHLQQTSDVLFQASTLSALAEGDFHGDMTYRNLKKHGDTGLGTFDELDGEMIGLDGEFYQIKADGSVHAVDGSMKAPFAEVTFFKPDRTILLADSMNGIQFESFLDDQLPTKNIFYVFKIEGAFTSIKARSVPKQNRPYPSLNDVIKEQSVFEFRNIRGTLIGVRCPAYTAGINSPGYHFHFISADRKSGGHVLEFQVQSVKIEIDDISEFSMVLPGGRDFYNLDLGKARY